MYPTTIAGRVFVSLFADGTTDIIIYIIASFEKHFCNIFILPLYQFAFRPSGPKIATLVKNHWRVENELHWTLDVSFNEDQCRVRIENAAENLARIRRISLILLKNDKSCKLGIKSKRA